MILRRRILRLACLFGCLVAASAEAQVDYVTNSGFDQGLTGWQAQQGDVSWSSSVGHDGPGSIEMSDDSTGDSALAQFGRCLVVPDEPADWAASIWVIEETPSSGACSVYLYFYSDPFCEDHFLTSFPNPEGGDSGWEQLTKEIQTPTSGIRGMRFGLSANTSNPSGITCWFDDAEILGPPPAAEIPTLGRVGLLVLALLVSGLGLIQARRLSLSPR